MQHSLNFAPLTKRSFSWMFTSRPEDQAVENEIILTTPDFSFDLIIERGEDDFLRYSIRRHGAINDLNPLRRFELAQEAARYLYDRGVSCADEMINLGVVAMG